MMRPKFSEFTYGYAAVRELEDVGDSMFGGSSSPPLLPSLKAEKNLGYDAQILTVRLAIFVQFKLGEYVSKSHPDSPTWWHIRKAHYRATVESEDHQLAALLDLENRGMHRGRPIWVCYVAPAFHEWRTFAAHYASGSVLDHSYGFYPSDVPLDGHTHHRVITPDLSINRMLSEPVDVPNRLSRDGLDPRLYDIVLDQDTQFSLVSLEQQVQAACMAANLIPRQVMRGLDDATGVLDQLHIWCQYLGVLPLIWVDAPPSDDDRSAAVDLG